MAMRPSGALMIEHRLIERFIGIIRGRLGSSALPDPVFIDTAVDFFRTYADRTHHGKEEDILFRDLARVKMDPVHTVMMNDLIADHKSARAKVGFIVEQNARYRNGDRDAVYGIISTLKALCEFYPVHIRKEDEVFFPAAMKYFPKEQVERMLAEFWEFDRKMIHEKYRKVVDGFEKG